MAPDPSPSDQRWQRAVAVARVVPCPPPADTARRARRDQLASSAVVLVLAGTGLVLAWGRRAGTDAADPSVVSWTRIGLQAGLAVAGLVLLVLGVVVSVRSGQWRARTSGPLTQLAGDQRRRAVRQLRGHEAVRKDDEQVLLVLRAVATGLLRPWGALLAMCGVLVNTAGIAVGAARLPGLAVLWVVALVAFAVASLALLRDQRAAQRFLEQHPPDAAGWSPPPAGGARG